MFETFTGRFRSTVLTATVFWLLAVTAAALPTFGVRVPRSVTLTLASLFTVVAGSLLIARSPRLAHWLDRLHLTLVFGFVKDALDLAARVAADRAYWDRLVRILGRYGVPPPDLAARERALLQLPDSADEDERRRACAEALLRHVGSGLPAAFSRPALEYLVRLRDGATAQELSDLWQEGDPGEGLAALLHGSPDWSRHGGRFPYRASDLAWALRRLGGFEPRQLEAELVKLAELQELPERYRSFLAERGIDTGPAKPLGPKVLLDALRGVSWPLTAPSLDEAAVTLLLRHRHLLAAAFPAATDAERASFNALAATLFYLGLPARRRRLCVHMAADRRAVELVHCYLEMDRDLVVDLEAARLEVSLDRLFHSWPEMVAERRRRLGPSFDKDLLSVHQYLEAGEWPIRLHRPLSDTLRREAETPEAQRLLATVERFPWLRCALERIFRDLKLSTIERYLETRKVNAYLITFMSTGGSLERLLAAMIDPAKRRRLEALGIELEVDGQPKYNFGNYTSHVRIGVLPRGWSFDAFFECFQADFRVVVEHRREVVPRSEWPWAHKDLENVELILHRFGLSGHNYYGFVSGLGIERSKALETLHELFTPLVSNEEVVALFNYEDPEIDLVEALIQAPLALVAEELLELGESERKALEKRETDDQLKAVLLTTCAQRSLLGLGKLLLDGGQELIGTKAEAAVPVLHPLLAQHREGLDETTTQLFVKTYLETLAALAAVRGA